jgi:hypothetical protein
VNIFFNIAQTVSNIFLALKYFPIVFTFRNFTINKI